VLRFVAHATHRAPVATGPWSGTLTAPGGVTGRVQIHVTDQGRIVDSFAVTESCSFAWSQNYPEFVDPNGTFTGPISVPTRLAGVRTGWQGRFAGPTVTGTVTTPNNCGDSTKPLIATFIAHRG
jgi:hypothetical protein